MKANKTRKKLLIVLLSVTVLMTGCYIAKRPILMWAYGIHQPRIETKGSILHASERFGLDPNRLVSVAPTAWYQLLHKYYHGVPDAILFNKEGQFISYKAQTLDCNAGLFSFISRLDRHKSYSAGDSITLKTALQDLRDLDGKPLVANYANKDVDFYLLISWADYTGRLNKDHVSAWQQLADDNKQAKIQVIEVNFDGQSWWPAEAKDSLLQKLTL